MKKWITNRHVNGRCPVCGKMTASVEKASMSNGKQRRILKCYNPRCRHETR